MNIKKHITVINGKKKSPHNEGIIVYVCECNRHLHFTKTFVEEKLEELKNTNF